MPYTAITDEAGIEDAFETLRDIFQEGAEELGSKLAGCTRRLHRNCRIWGAFGERKKEYLIMFGRDERDRNPIFQADPPRTGSNARHGKGLFVRNAEGHRFLTHRGTFSSRSRLSQKAERLCEFPHLWIGVEGVEDKLFPITPIDKIDTITLVGRIDRFTRILEGKGREDSVKREARSALNTILYGPPGTGKTYETFRRCVEICDGMEISPDENDKIRGRYKELVREGRIEFVTFHQSYGYEEFVEGLRPDTGPAEEAGIGFCLVPTSGVLKRIAKRARDASGPIGEPFDLAGRQVFKMSLGNPNAGDEYQIIFDECIENGYVLLNYGGNVDFTDAHFATPEEIGNHLKGLPDIAQKPDTIRQYINHLRNGMQNGDLVIVPARGGRFRAIGEVIGPYEFVLREDGRYNQRRRVRWLWQGAEGEFADIYNGGEFVRRTIYPLDREDIIDDKLRCYIDPKPHVLVIDEINRANVSKVMGELITLLEEDKREGAENEVAVTLPHSGDRFTLPANLYILGTMNTADRSIALLDTALRRRFEFEELTPEPESLGTVDGIVLPDVLRAINQRLEYLIDRDHLIGHAWLMGAHTRTDVDRIMRHKIIPLIAEYFYDDWQKVRAVLGGTDDFVQGRPLVRPPGLGDDTDAGEDRRHWTVQKDFAKGAYDRLISGRAQDSGQARNPEQAQGSGQAPDTETGTD